MTASSPESEHGKRIHQVLAQSYLVYFAAVILGFAFDLIRPVQFDFPAFAPLGFLFIILGTFLIVWAQRASGKSAASRDSLHADSKGDKICRDHFCVGPYVFTRSPTQYGLSLMALGLALVYGSFFMTVFTVIAFLLGRFVFIRQEEAQLAQKYGEAYLEYKRSVKL